MIDVKFTPNNFKKSQVIIVIDVLRATTSIITAISNGAKYVIPVETIEEAKKYKDKGFLICGERGGVKPKDFDLGNSPLEYEDKIVKNKKIVITTTNGTKALAKAKKHSENIVLGAFINFTKTVEYLLKFDDLLFVCSGNDGEESFEDTQVAGAFINKLLSFRNYDLSDSALISLQMWKNLEKPTFIGKHAHVLEEYGYGDDVKFAAQIDKYDTVIVYKDGKLIKWR